VILYLSVLVAIRQTCIASSPFTALAPVLSKPIVAFMNYFVMASFAVLAMLASRGRAKRIAATGRK